MSGYWNIAGVRVHAKGDTAVLSRMGGLEAFSSDSETETMQADLNLELCSSFAEASTLEHYLSQQTPLYRIEYFWNGNVTEMDFYLPEDTGPVCHCSYDDSIRTASMFFSEAAVGAVRFAFWEVFGFAAIERGIAPVHSAAVVCRGESIMFLGGSGAGKSTQAALWTRNIPDCSLLNDDSPVINTGSSEIEVFGSPWGGKTPLFINRHYPVRAFVRVRKSPDNKIYPLGTLQKVAALLPSFSPALRMHSVFASKLQKLTITLADRTEVISMDCLPESSAALLCFNYLNKKNIRYEN